MNVIVKVFPIAGLSDETQEMAVTLSDGNLCELIALIQKRLDADLRVSNIMILHNGHSIDIDNDTALENGDRVWLMPRLSGG